MVPPPLAGDPLIRLDGLPPFFVLASSSQAIGFRGEWYRLVTANFLHIAWDHVSADVVLLVGIGWAVERLIGARLVIVAYVLTGTSALAAAYAFESCQSLLGASAAVFGLIGLLTGYGISEAVQLRRVTPQARNMVLIVAAVLVLDALASVPGTDHLAHLWGLAAGVPIGLTSHRLGTSRLPLIATLAGLTLLTVGLVVWRSATFSCVV